MIMFRSLLPLLILLFFGRAPSCVFARARYVMYLTGQHPIIPSPDLVSSITHVALAFMPSSTFNTENPTEWPLFTSISTVREKFAPGTVMMVAIGGWGDTQGFAEAAKTEEGREKFARNVAKMVKEMGADGVDIDWEYPGGNGEDYKQTPNSQRVWQITAYPLLLSTLRSYLGPHKLLSAAVPGLSRDMLAFTPSTLPNISSSLDFFNVMTYDLMNRRDNVTKHHTGIGLSLESMDAYLRGGVPVEKVNLGFAFYVKYFRTDPHGGCDVDPVGCKTTLMEDPETGADLGQTGGFSWHDDVPVEAATSFSKALAQGQYDASGGGHYFWDRDENLFWTWDTPEAIAKKFPAIVEEKGLGGVFAWGLGEDAPDFAHLRALTAGMESNRFSAPRLEEQVTPSPSTPLRSSGNSGIREKEEL